MEKYRGSLFEGGTGFQAAIVDIYKHGLFENIQKIDYRGFYPSVVMTFNISPETTKINRYIPYQEDFEVEMTDNNHIIIFVPDKRMNKTVVIEIDQNVPGFLPQKLIEFDAERMKIKERLANKDISDAEKTHLESVSWGLKVLANSTCYGCNANGFFKYGDLSLAIAIVGLSRHYITKVLELYPETKIETDTDGIYINGEVDIEKINFFLKEYTLDTFKIPFEKNKLLLEIEGPFDAAYFYKTKNYLLYNKGKVIRHGVTFLSSSKTALFNKALDKIARYIFEKKSVVDAVNKLINEESTLKDFTMKTSINQPISSYKNEGCLQKQLAKQVKEHLKQDLQVSDSIDYVKTKNGYKILTLAKLHEIDKRYYYDQLQTLINIFTEEQISIEQGGAVIQKTLGGY